MMMVSSRSQIKTRSKFDSGSGDGFGALRFLFRALLDPPGNGENPNNIRPIASLSDELYCVVYFYLYIGLVSEYI
jgi:hypothetical protein